ncbi:MAG: SDR family oxidoreductase, partial [Longimicrobiales bacterium]|nr:SDR family oxidoreductase [Longimicrobiales bacterium]
MIDQKHHHAEEDDQERPVALVTGGAVRVGRAIALGLAEAGHDVVIGYHSSGSVAADTVREIEALGVACHAVQADLAKPDGSETLVDGARGRFGRLDVVVNSAASFRSMPLREVDADEFDSVMALNVRAPHLVVRAAEDLLREASGCVVNITDLSAFQAWTSYPHHAVSKAALAHLTRVQARSYAPHIRVNAIAPGAVLAPDDWSQERWDAVAERAVLRRTGSPDDVVEAVLYLVTADFVTGHVIPVDGGRLLGATG